MKKIISLLVFTIFLFTTNAWSQFKQVEGGIQYLIIPAGEGEPIKQGEFFEMHIVQTYEADDMDTVLYDSRKTNAQIAQFDSAIIPPDFYTIFSGMRKGDSLVIKQLADSLMSKPGLPPFIKKGGVITAHYKVTNIYRTTDVADSAYRSQAAIAKAKDSAEAVIQLVLDNMIIDDYLAKKNIKTVKAPKGTYVQIIKQGTGPFASAGKTVKVFYTGKTIPGEKVFDSNTDPAFSHTEVYQFTISKKDEAPQVIQGWEDGFSLLRKGAVARLFIPSVLAYGKNERGENIDANQCMYFDIKIVDVFTEGEVKKSSGVKLPQKKRKK